MEIKKLYKVVDFIEYTTNEKMCVDIVCAIHIRYDPARGLLAKFMEGPYNKEDSLLIHNIVKNTAPAPEIWPEYKIKIIKETETYEQALKELATLDKKKYFHATDSDSSKEIPTLSKKATQVSPKETTKGIDELFDVPELTDYDTGADLNGKKVSETTSNKDGISQSKDEKLNINSSRAYKRKLLNNEPSEVLEKRFKETEIHEDRMEMMFGVLLYLREEFHNMKNEMKDIKKELQDMKKHIHRNEFRPETSPETLASKFEVNLPLKTLEEFDKLEELLPNSKELQHSLKNALLYNLDVKADLKKMMRQILSALMDRNVATQFTVSKLMPKKRLFGNTSCCTIVEGIIPFKCGEKMEKYSKPEVIGAISYVFTRAYDWGSGRNDRRKNKENNAANQAHKEKDAPSAKVPGPVQ